MADTGKKKKKKRSKIAKILDVVIPVVAAGVFIYAAVNLILVYKSYGEAQAIYDGLAIYVNEDAPEAGSVEEEQAISMVEAGFPYINVDFEGLHAMNEDFLGWLYFPLLELSYPVVLGDEDFNYLHMSIDKSPSNSGCIFIDCASDPNLKDMSTIVYGHNMRNGSMFGSLKKIRTESGLIDQDPYFYYYTAERAYKCHVFAYYLDRDGGLTYQAPESVTGYDEYLNYVLDMNEYEAGPGNVDLAHRPRLVTLSTCSGHNSGKRTVVMAVIEDTYAIDSETIVNGYFDSEIESE